MAKPENNENFPEKQAWGTWEELLLACAVHRFGTDSWDSVTVEVQKRSPALHSLTATACRQKYLDLKRRFSRKAALPESAKDETAAAPWLEELRRLRVAELRREVERYDLSISSLQLKVKRLEEERERSLKEEETETENSDLDKIAEEKKERHREPDSNSGERVTGRPNQSVNESNSPDPKDNSPGTGSEDANREGNRIEPITKEPDRTGGDTKPAGEDSCRGSCESVAKESAANSDRVDQERGAGDSLELFESMAESKGGRGRGEEEAKETSDVQSSASLPRKGGEEPVGPDNEDQSPTVKGIPVESQPLADFLEMLQAKTFGSYFSRRLESQETAEYKKIIRQHVDLEMIRTRLEEGWYTGSICCKFFRDLLLLVNNATLFYGKGSSEFKAAGQLNQLVKKEMALKMPKQTSPPKEQSSVAAKPVSESLHPLSLKPRMSVPIIACRKRSSLAARSSASASGPDKKTTKITPVIDQKPVSVVEKEDETSDKDDEPLISKKRMRERPSSSAKKVTNRNVKNRSNTDTRMNAGFPSKGRSSNDSSEPKKADQEKKGSTSASSKKQSVASFLKRMKGGSSSDTGSLLETVKTNSGADSSNGKRGAEQKKNGSGNDKGDAGKAQNTQKRANGKKQANDKGSPAKKSTGRAPKRGAAPSTPLLAKRGKEAGEKEGGSSTRPKKRSRR